LKSQEKTQFRPVRFRSFLCRVCCIIFSSNFDGPHALPKTPCNMNATWARLELDHSNPDPRGKSRPRISPPKRVPKGNRLARPELLCREERRETNTSKKCHRPRRH